MNKFEFVYARVIRNVSIKLEQKHQNCIEFYYFVIQIYADIFFKIQKGSLRMKLNISLTMRIIHFDDKWKC